jgi:hypothetical protein
MIDLPEGTRAEFFGKVFVRGAIFYCENYSFDDGTTRDKFLLIMNPTCEKGYSHYFLATSQIDKILSSRILKNESLIIPAGSVGCFSKDTGITVRWSYSGLLSYFQKRFLDSGYQERLEFREMLPAQYLDEIVRLVRASKYLSPIQKRNLAPEICSID